MPADLTSLTEIAQFINWNAFLFLVITLTLLFLAKRANHFLVNYNLDEELTGKGNKAVAVSLSGFILAIGLVLDSALDMPTHSGYLIQDSLKIVVWGTVSCVFLLLSRLFNDRFILPRFSNQRELIEDQNIGVGAVQAGGYIATALLIRGAILRAEVDGLGLEVLISGVWFIVSQVLLLTYARIYTRITSINVHQELEKNNTAVGVSFGGCLISFGILISFYLLNFESILGLFIWVLLSSAILKGITLIVDKVYLPSHPLKKEMIRDRNWGVALIEAITSIIAALILTGSLF